MSVDKDDVDGSRWVIGLIFEVGRMRGTGKIFRLITHANLIASAVKIAVHIQSSLGGRGDLVDF